MLDIPMPEPKFQRRAAIKALRLCAEGLGNLALGNEEAANKFFAAATAYVELAKVQIESPVIQGALNALPID